VLSETHINDDVILTKQLYCFKVGKIYYLKRKILKVLYQNAKIIKYIVSIKMTTTTV